MAEVTVNLIEIIDNTSYPMVIKCELNDTGTVLLTCHVQNSEQMTFLTEKISEQMTFL